jgi:hypothetical protein
VDTALLEAFKAEARAEGYDEIVERKWAPSTVVDIHTHAFAVRALVVQGEMWLKVGRAERHLRPGDEFALDRETPHSERYGPEGATYWAARRNRQPVRAAIEWKPEEAAMTAIEELKTARDELVLLMATLEPGVASQAASVLARVERALELLKPQE